MCTSMHRVLFSVSKRGWIFPLWYVISYTCVCKDRMWLTVKHIKVYVQLHFGALLLWLPESDALNKTFKDKDRSLSFLSSFLYPFIKEFPCRPSPIQMDFIHLRYGYFFACLFKFVALNTRKMKRVVFLRRDIRKYGVKTDGSKIWQVVTQQKSLDTKITNINSK